ncbi:ATP-grasp domain-containing protein [Synechococcus sp. 1G10]|uniref:ATP-grasp domain-containing protein n=1 Tax=Synechococcus sp. 1G10 TaxID=2025605 RepID=UPI000B9870AE|nr:ATP-grasp domain-containing protein [Synechococcus sp. 1G10]
MTNVLVFPSGTGIAQEIFFALRDCKNIHLLGASSLAGDLGSYLFTTHYSLPYVTEPSFLSELSDLCRMAQIDVIYPAHDDAVLTLALQRELIPAQVIAPSSQSCLICRSKTKTYQLLERRLPVPRLYSLPPKNLDAYPLFVKPDKGQGSKDAYKVATPEELISSLDRIVDPVITEYLPGKEFTVDCFSDRSDGLLYSQGRERVRVRSGIAMNTMAAHSPAFAAMATIIHEELQMNGPWFFQVRAREGGEMVLLEVGPRVAGAMAMSRAMGVNLPLLGLHQARGERVTIQPVLVHMAMERSYRNHYRHQLDYGAVYMDLDDTVVVHGKVNVRIISFVYQCLNNCIPVILITRHAGVLEDTLERYRLRDLFADVIHIAPEQPKSQHINLNLNPIFIDDSFLERSQIATALGIPVFDPSMIEVLMEP